MFGCYDLHEFYVGGIAGFIIGALAMLLFRLSATKQKRKHNENAKPKNIKALGNGKNNNANDGIK